MTAYQSNVGLGEDMMPLENKAGNIRINYQSWS